jgi:hypothetical protein
MTSLTAPPAYELPHYLANQLTWPAGASVADMRCCQTCLSAQCTCCLGHVAQHNQHLDVPVAPLAQHKSTCAFTPPRRDRLIVYKMRMPRITHGCCIPNLAILYGATRMCLTRVFFSSSVSHTDRHHEVGLLCEKSVPLRNSTPHVKHPPWHSPRVLTTDTAPHLRALVLGLAQQDPHERVTLGSDTTST